MLPHPLMVAPETEWSNGNCMAFEGQAIIKKGLSIHFKGIIVTHLALCFPPGYFTKFVNRNFKKQGKALVMKPQFYCIRINGKPLQFIAG